MNRGDLGLGRVMLQCQRRGIECARMLLRIGNTGCRLSLEVFELVHLVHRHLVGMSSVMSGSVIILGRGNIKV